MAEGEKCERCWMYSTTVGEDKGKILQYAIDAVK